MCLLEVYDTLKQIPHLIFVSKKPLLFTKILKLENLSTLYYTSREFVDNALHEGQKNYSYSIITSNKNLSHASLSAILTSQKTNTPTYKNLPNASNLFL